MNNNIFFINDNTFPNHTPGKGFGNLDVSNNIRYGNSSRQFNNEYKEHLESKVSFEYKIDYLNNNNNNNNNNNIFTKNTYTPLFINDGLYSKGLGNNIIDRVGETTRKQNQLNINRDIINNTPHPFTSPNKDQVANTNNFKFIYE